MSKNLFRSINFVFLLAIALLLTPELKAQDSKIYIDVGKASVKRSLLALPPFLYYGSKNDKKERQAGEELFQTVKEDFETTGYFRFIQPAAYLVDPRKTGLKPKGSAKEGKKDNGFQFKNWKAIGSEFLVRGGYRVSNGKMEFEVYLYYVPKGKLVLGKQYNGSLSSARKIGHTFANDVIEKLTNKKGIFTTKIVVARKKVSNTHKEIVIMDWDGENITPITQHKTISMSPAWSPNGQKVAYTAFAFHKKAKTRNPDLFLYDRESKKRWLVSYRKGMNSGADFLPDGKSMVLSISRDENPDIFRVDLEGNILNQLTDGPLDALNLEPEVSPDGKKVAFSSDRGGKPMVYVVPISGEKGKKTKAKQRTFAGRYNSTPVWSPDGKKIVFAGQKNGNFNIYIMDANGQNLKPLTASSGNDESPTFSPDGRHIMFTSDRSGRNQLYIVNTDGTNERRVTFDSNSYYKPDWSPYFD